MLSTLQARKIIPHAAVIAGKGKFGTGIEAVYRLIEHLGFLQLDTIGGKLMVRRNNAFKKIYELPLNLLPPET